MVFASFCSFERGLGEGEGKEGYDEAKMNDVQAKLPKKIKKRRMIQDENGARKRSCTRSVKRPSANRVFVCFVLATGADAGWEEYYDYVFPDDEKAGTGMKLLELAHAWKNAKKRKAADAGVDE
jgi:crooked neck